MNYFLEYRKVAIFTKKVLWTQIHNDSRMQIVYRT